MLESILDDGEISLDNLRQLLVNPKLGDFLRESGVDNSVWAKRGRFFSSIVDERSFSKAILSRALLGLARQNTVNVMSANS